MFSMLVDGLSSFAMKTGIAEIIANFTWDGAKTLIMLLIACVLLYLAIVKKFEPLLLLPIAFGMLLANLPLGGVMHPEYFIDPEYLIDGKDLDFGLILHEGGLLDLLYLGVKLGIYPPLIFLGIGCMTDFGPLISNPKSILLGAAAQLGVFITFFCAVVLGAFGIGGFGADGNVATIFKEAASIAFVCNCYCSLQLHGAYSSYSASHNESTDNKEGKTDCYGTASSCFKNRKNHFPHCRNTYCSITCSRCGKLGWYAYAW